MAIFIKFMFLYISRLDMSEMVQKINNYYLCGANRLNEKAANSCKPPFGNGEDKSSKELNELSKVSDDSRIKVPMQYKKTGELNLPYGLKAHCYKLANGQQVVVVPKEGKTVLRSYVNTGSLNETDDIRGISHYIEHNLFNGSDGLAAGEFFETTDRIGAETNASTGLAETNYFISSNLLNDTDLEEEMRIHSSMLESPRFAIDMLEKEKGVVNSEINMITSNPQNIAFNTTIKSLFNIKTTSEDVIAGTTDNITNLTREDVVEYYNKNYFPANMVTVISGEVEPEETIKLVSKYFTSTKSNPISRHYQNLIPIEKPVRRDIISDKTQAAFTVMGFSGPKNNDLKSDIYTTALLKLMFSYSDAEKMFREDNALIDYAQEKVLASPNAPSAITIVVESSDANSERVLKKIYSRIQDFQNKPVSEEQLKIIKRDMKKMYVNMFESSFAINDFIGASILEGKFKDINDIENIINNMTAGDLQDIAKKYTDLNKVAITVVHPASANEKTISENYNNNKSVSFTGKTKQAINMEHVKQYGLNNNYRVSFYDSQYPNIDAGIMYRVEKPVYSKNPAARAVLNEILCSGTMFHSREDFEKSLEQNGGGVMIFADNNGIAAVFDSSVEDYSKIYGAFKELLENPRFTEETFKEAVAVIKDNVLRADKTPWNKLNPMLHPKTKNTDEDILKGLELLTLDDVNTLYNELYSNSHAVVSIAAPISTYPELKNTILKSVNEMRTVQPYTNVSRSEYEPVEASKVLTDIDNKSQANILMAYKYIDNGNIKDKASICLLNKILGGGPSSRLFSDLRESQKLAYSVKSSVSKENDTGTMVLSIGTTTDNKLTGEKSYENLQK